MKKTIKLAILLISLCMISIICFYQYFYNNFMEKKCSTSNSLNKVSVCANHFIENMKYYGEEKVINFLLEKKDFGYSQKNLYDNYFMLPSLIKNYNNITYDTKKAYFNMLLQSYNDCIFKNENEICNISLSHVYIKIFENEQIKSKLNPKDFLNLKQNDDANSFYFILANSLVLSNENSVSMYNYNLNVNKLLDVFQFKLNKNNKKEFCNFLNTRLPSYSKESVEFVNIKKTFKNNCIN